MKLRLLCTLALASACFAQTEVGAGAPSEAIRLRWISSYYRNGFSTLVVAPTTAVVKFGTTGLSQEFSDVTNTGGTRYALVKATQSSTVVDEAIDVFQVYPGIYASYKGAVGTYGYPLSDSTPCFYAGDLSCIFQTFDKNYAVFAYARANANGQVFVTRDPYYTKWAAAGGITRMGAADNVETAVTSFVSNAAATMQSFSSGAIYNITAGTLSGRILAVRAPIFYVFSQNGGHAGFLGYPSGEELVLPNGNRRQSFEGGAIDYDPTNGGAVLRPGVKNVVITTNTGTLKLNVGETSTYTASVYAANGELLTDRVVNWTSSNGRVVSLQANGATVTLKAVGQGSASVTAVADGKASPPLQVIVSGVCCQIGEGAPSVSMQQSFVDAATRNRLVFQLPTQNPVRRAGSGYVQDFTAASGDQRYLLALSDNSAVAWLVTGQILNAYTQMGGPAGSMGYPAADPTATGRQLFQNGALAGDPVRLVTGSILSKWATLSYETGAAGSPIGETSKFLTFGAAAGLLQPFSAGTFYSIQTGSSAGKTFLVSGVILARYAELGGPSGNLGAPWTDEFTRDGRRRQEFEGGIAEYWPGLPVEITLRDRKPVVDATPDIVPAGSRVRLAVSGFADQSSLRISISGQPDFVVNTKTGSYSWEAYVPANATGATVTVKATQMNGSTSAQGSYLVRSVAEARPHVVKLEGDNQVGVAGGVLAKSLKVAVRDDAGNAILGIPVSFEASPGSQILSSSQNTDVNGEASAILRLAASEGVVLATARVSGSAPVTFSARVADSTVNNFPKFLQSGETPVGDGTGTMLNQGAMVTATASILRYMQDRGDLVSSVGLIDPASLNQYLSKFCAIDAQGNQLCDGYLTPAPNSPERIVNFWRIGGLFGNNLGIVVEKVEQAALRDALGLGSPVLIGLSLTVDGVALGSHYVAGIGIAADGAIRIQDPSPVFARNSLSEYLDGFSSGSQLYKATLASVVRFVAVAPASAGFLVVSPNAPDNGTLDRRFLWQHYGKFAGGGRARCSPGCHTGYTSHPALRWFAACL